MEFNSEPIYSYRTVNQIKGSLIFLNKIEKVRYDEIVQIETPNGLRRRGQVIAADENATIIQVFEGTDELDTEATEVTFTGEVYKLGLSDELLGRTLNGLGEVQDDLGPIIPTKEVTIDGHPINPIRRKRPDEFIETGISSIDGLNALVRGQKLPIFTGAGLPTAQVAAQIATNIAEESRENDLQVIFVALGITQKEAKYYRRRFDKSAAEITFLSNLVMDSNVERILAPHVGLTIAEYIAFDLEMETLVILNDVLNYAEALREISSFRGEFPGRRGYPPYTYTSLAKIFERAGMIKKRDGSITLIPIVTMPNDDITHPIPDLSGYICEGQIFMDRELHKKEIFPPIDPAESLSRLMDEGVGDEKTREDHEPLASQLFAAYSEGRKLERLVSISGESSISEKDQKYIDFLHYFEQNYLNQPDRRSIEQTLDIGWKCLTKIPRFDLNRISNDLIDKYLPGDNDV